MKGVVAKLGDPLHGGRLFSSAFPGRKEGIGDFISPRHQLSETTGTGNFSEVLSQGKTAVAPSKNFRKRVTQGL